MATYKEPCVHCGELAERDALFCGKCGSNSPFGYSCPTCLKPITKDQKVCSGCGRQVYITCPTCKKEIFADTTCGHCNGNLMIKCTNSRCGKPQFFQNVNCAVCGKKIKK